MMKIRLFLLTFCLLCFNFYVSAQRDSLNERKIDIQVSIGGRISILPKHKQGNVFTVNGDFISKGNWILSLDANFIKFPVSSLPSNYSSGSLVFDFTPGDLLNAYGVLAGKRFRDKNKQLSLSLKAGATVVSYSEVSFVEYTYLFGSVWQTDVLSPYEHTVGVSYVVDVVFSINKNVGFGFDFAGNMNKLQSYFGFGLSLTIGHLR